jgi:cysteine-rich repeat protein
VDAPPGTDPREIVPGHIRGIALVYCGDGLVDPEETCDDGNSAPSDGCEPDCTETIAVPAASRGGSLLLALALLVAATVVLLRRPTRAQGSTGR